METSTTRRGRIVSADPADSDALTNLTMLSKNYWNYGREQMQLWKEELTITPGYIASHHVEKLEVEGRIIGYLALIDKSPDVLLDNLFILPDEIGKGFGEMMMQYIFTVVRRMHYRKIILESDPHAVAFYERYGFRTTGRSPTSIEGRYLPIMELAL